MDMVTSWLAAAFDFVERTGERRHLAELYRLRGECLRRERGAPHPCYDQALTLARRQGARLWELRAATAAAELAGADGSRQDAPARSARASEVS